MLYRGEDPPMLCQYVLEKQRLLLHGRALRSDVIGGKTIPYGTTELLCTVRCGCTHANDMVKERLRRAQGRCTVESDVEM
jgi:hypothetical protein